MSATGVLSRLAWAVAGWAAVGVVGVGVGTVRARARWRRVTVPERGGSAPPSLAGVRVGVGSWVGSVVDGPALARRWAGVSRRWRWGSAGSDAEHAELLESVARSLRSGASLAGALEQAAATPGRGGLELGLVLQQVRGGIPLPVAIDAWAEGDDRARTLSGAALALGAELGGARAQALDAAASGLRDRAGLHREIRALTAQARASAAVMVLAPVAFALVSWQLDAGVARVLTSPVGLACLAGGAALDGVGAWWMAALARRVS